MNPTPHQTPIHPDDLQRGTYLRDTFQGREKAIHRVEAHDSFVQLFSLLRQNPYHLIVTIVWTIW